MSKADQYRALSPPKPPGIAERIGILMERRSRCPARGRKNFHGKVTGHSKQRYPVDHAGEFEEGASGADRCGVGQEMADQEVTHAVISSP